MEINKMLANFTQAVKNTYQDDLISLILFGSAASGEFVKTRSNLNLLIVLKNTELEQIKRSAQIINGYKQIKPVFMTESYILSSLDIFPIEFLDMQDNYKVLFGKDVLKTISIDTRNLRFQCEHELKAKLINLKGLYPDIYKNKKAQEEVLLASFKSVVHILRSALRLKGKNPVYTKNELVNEIANQFGLDFEFWKRILAARNKQEKICGCEIEVVFRKFIQELEKATEVIDKL